MVQQRPNTKNPKNPQKYNGNNNKNNTNTSLKSKSSSPSLLNTKSKSPTPVFQQGGGGGGGQSLKSIEVKKRTIFKPILTNPYTSKYQWPIVRPELASDIVDYLISQIIPQLSRALELKNDDTVVDAQGDDDVLKYVKYQYNEINKLLEDQAKKSSNDDGERVKYLFVCKNDITPFLIIQHLPMLCAMANVKLVQLPGGTSHKLTKEINSTSTLVNRPVDMLCLCDNYCSDLLKNVIEGNIDDVNIGFLKTGQFAKSEIKFLKNLQPVLPKNNVQKLDKGSR